MMHATRGPSSISTSPPEDALDLSLSGSQLAMAKRPSSASPGKCFTRSVSVSVASDGRGKRNTLGDGGQRSIKNLRRSNSTTQVNQQATSLSLDQSSSDYLTLLDSSPDGHVKLSGLSKASSDRTTWNILDDQPRAFLAVSSPRSTGSADSPTGPRRREPAISLAATFTANNRSNKGAVGNSVTTILHNNYSEKPLTPKSSNQKPSFNNLLKATANDDASLENGSVTKSQKNFSSLSSNNKGPSRSPRGSSPVQASPRRREVSEEEAERFIQQVNQAAVTIQRWYRRHAAGRRAGATALRRILATKRKEWQERAEDDGRREQQKKKDEDRRRIREEKARLARLAAIQELQQKRALQVSEVRRAADVQLESLRQAAGGRRKPSRTSAASQSNNGPAAPPDLKAKNTDHTARAAAAAAAAAAAGTDSGRLGFGDVTPETDDHTGAQSHQVDVHPELQRQDVDRRPARKEKCRPLDAPQEVQPEVPRSGGRRKTPRVDRSPASPSDDGPASPTAVKAKNTDANLKAEDGLAEPSGFRSVSPAVSNCRGSQSSQEILRRSVSVEDQRRASSSKTTLHELLDTLKLLEEPERPRASKSYGKDKYAWIDEDGDSTSLTADNLERHGQLSLHPPLPRGAALLSEAKLQSIMSFLDEMEKSEQERPRSITSGSHREAVLSEEELAGVEQASATAAELGTSMMRTKLELEEKKRTVVMLQAALAQQRELTVQHVKETERELSRSFQLQKEQYESTIQRHLTFIDQLISDKKALSERCEGVVGELKQVDQKYTRKISQMQEQHEMEIKKLKELMSASEKIRREKWIDEKTRKIKEIAVKGLEPEIQKLVSKHKQELKRLRSLHEAELLQAEQRGEQRLARQGEELRLQQEKDREEACHRERELARQRYEKQLQEEEVSLQQQRRRLYKEVADEKERQAQLAARQRCELEEVRRQLEENSSLAGRALREELDRSREEQERRHQVEMKALQERLDVEKLAWEESYKKKEEAWLLSRERELRDELRRERDKEIELAIWTLEEETSKDKEECERAADNRVKRVREKLEAELREAERSERDAVEKQQQLRKRQMETEGELIRLEGLLRQKEQEIQDVTQTRDKLAEERRGLADIIRREFAERLVQTEEENRRMKTEVSEVRARLRLELERVSREKEEELAEVHQRVKSAILKKEETVNNLRKQHEAALKRADHLEALWEQQRKQLLEK